MGREAILVGVRVNDDPIPDVRGGRGGGRREVGCAGLEGLLVGSEEDRLACEEVSPGAEGNSS